MFYKIKVLQQNLRKSPTAHNELRQSIMQNIPDILALQEPYVFKNRVPFPLSSRMFHSNMLDNVIYCSIIILNKSLIVKKLDNFTNSFATAILIQTKLSSLVFVNIYLHSNIFCDIHQNYFTSILSTYSNLPIIFCGDFNARNPYWNDSTTNRNGYKFKEVITSHNLIVLNDKSKTCRNASIIDLTITNSKAYSYITNWNVTRLTEISDHETINFNISSPNDEFGRHYIKSTWKFVENNMQNFVDNINPDKIQELNLLINNCHDSFDIDLVISKLSKIYIEAAYLSLPVRKSSSFPKKFSWWTPNLEAQKRHFHYIKNLYYRRDPRVSEDEYKIIRNNYTRSIRLAKRESFRSFLEDAESNTHYGNTFKLIKSLLNKVNNQIPMIDQVSTSSKPVVMNQMLNALFPDDVTSNDNMVARNIRNHHFNFNNLISTTFSFDDLILCINNLNSKKAPGLDHITNNMIKSSAELLAPSILLIFNKCLQVNYFPNSWKTATVRILAKPNKSNYHDVKSYRPISLLSNFAKIFERLLNKKLYSHFENFIHPEQHGFVKNKSTITALESIINTSLSRKSSYKTAIIAIDIASAFDKAWWPAILYELDKHDVPSDLIKLMSSYLTNRSANFNYGDFSIWKTLTNGCPQGGALSPLLWIILLNNLLVSYNIPNSKIVAFADDITIICWASSIIELTGKIKTCIEYVENWCDNRKLSINHSKTNILYLFNNSKPIINLNNGTSIHPCDTMKILGLTFGNHRHRNKLNFTPHILNTTNKIQRISNILFALIGNTWGISHKKRVNLYKGMIRPAIMYGYQIWGDKLIVKTKNKLNSIQHHILLKSIYAYQTVSCNIVCILNNVEKLTDYIDSSLITYKIQDKAVRKIVMALRKKHSINNYFNHVNDNFKSFFPTSHIPYFFKPNFFNVQFITGHGLFMSYLHRINVKPSPACECGHSYQDPSHILFNCSLHRQFQHNISSPSEFMLNKCNLSLFNNFCKGYIISHY